MNEFSNVYEALSLRLAQTLFHFLWQGAAIGVSAVLLERLLTNLSARRKYVMHVMAMVMMAACLPATFAWLDDPPLTQASVFGRREPAPTSTIATSGPPSVPAASVSDFVGNTVRRSTNSAKDSAQRAADPSPSMRHAENTEHAVMWTLTGPGVSQDRFNVPSSSKESFFSAIAPVIAVFYAVCVVGMLVRLAFAFRGGHRLKARSQPVSDTKVIDPLRRQAGRLGMRIVPAIAYCQQVSVPIVVGVLRPVILLPASLVTGLSADQLQAVIAHELAHLRRYDPLVNLIQRLIEAVTFFHPAIWYVSRRMDVQREYATDDLVVAAGWHRVNYADALVHMAELSKQVRLGKASMALAASGGSESEFKRRVVRLLGGESSRVRLTHPGLGMLLCVVSFVIITPLVLQTWARPVGSSNTAETVDGERIGKRIDNFALQDFRGRRHSLRDIADKRLVVVAFLGTECPLAKLYGKRLDELSRKYAGRGVTFVGINSNQQDTPTELGHYARRHGIDFPLLKDPGNEVADLFRAERTPEVFVLDQKRAIRYRGRIDDQFGVGYAKPAASTHYLAAAINDLLANRDVEVPWTESVGCHIGRVQRGAPGGDITYTSHIAAIMQSRCVECHRAGGIAPFGLESYDDVAAWSETIAEVVQIGRMPPWHANPKFGHFSNDARMPAEEKSLLLRWVDNGVPRGAGKPPAKRAFPDGWLMGQPDLVLKMPSAIEVPATGVVDYQYVEIDPGFTEGKWVRASEIRPGVRSVVHHIIVFINPPGGDPILEERGVGFETVGGYVPGAAPMRLPEGVARYVPPGSTLVFQLHYTPDGTPRRDQSEIGLYFADPTTIHHTMQMGVVVNMDFEIPARASDYRVVAHHRFSHDMELHTLAPHMHFRGKSFRFEAIYPHGTKEILLDVPNYDFNWQHTYQLAKPKLIPEGTLLKCTAIFDNSDRNLSNPDPTTSVGWGEQTWDEMMIGYFDGVFLNQDMTIPEPVIATVGDGTYRVRFRYKPDRPAKTVHLAGTFNDWSLSSHPLEDPDSDGIYTTDLTVEEGEYRYKFVIDGNYWTHDPASRILTGFLHESFFVAGQPRRTKK